MASTTRTVALVAGLPIALCAVAAWQCGVNAEPSATSKVASAPSAPATPVGGEADHLFPISVDGKAGYINGWGEVVIEPQWYDAWEFMGDRAVVWRLNGQSSWERAAIDRTGRIVTPFHPDEPQYEHTYSEGLFSFGTEEGVGFMDLYGNVAVPPKYHFPPFEETGADCYCVFEGGPVDGFHDGLALVHEGHKRYFIDRTGKRAFPLVIEEGLAFNEGYAPIRVKGKWGLIDKSGRFAIEPKYEHVGLFADGLTPVTMDGEEYYYVDRNGERAFEGSFSYAYPFSEGMASVSMQRGTIQYTYIDTSGKAVFTLPEGASPGEFKEGLVRVQLSTSITERNGPNSTLSYSISKDVFYDRTGRVVIELDPSDYHTGQFGHRADDFSHGLAHVWSQDKGRKRGYIDKKGSWVWWTKN